MFTSKYSTLKRLLTSELVGRPRFFSRKPPPPPLLLCWRKEKTLQPAQPTLRPGESNQNQRRGRLSLRSESARGCQRPPSPTAAAAAEAGGASAKRPSESSILDLPRPPPAPPRPLLLLRLLPRLPLPPAAVAPVRPSLLLLRLRLVSLWRPSPCLPRPPPPAPFMETRPPSPSLSLLPESRRSLPLLLRFLPLLECLWLLFLWCFLCLLDLWCFLCFLLPPSPSFSLPDPLSLLLPS